MATRDILSLDSVSDPKKITVPQTGDIYGAPRKVLITPEANTEGLVINNYSLTGTSALPGLDISGEWDTTGTPSLFRANVTDTNSDVDAMLVDIRRNNTNQFRVDRNGIIQSNTMGWRDMRAAVVAGGDTGGLGAPTLSAFGPSGTTYQYAFDVDEKIHLTLHVDHDIKPGSTVYPHVHWSTNGTSTDSVKWEISYTIATGHDTANFGTNTVVNVEEAAAGTAWRHMVTEDATGFLAPEPDSVMLMTLKRVTNGGTDNTDTVYGLFVDLHYQAERVGTPNRTPNFYTRS